MQSVQNLNNKLR